MPGGEADKQSGKGQAALRENRAANCTLGRKHGPTARADCTDSSGRMAQMWWSCTARQGPKVSTSHASLSDSAETPTRAVDVVRHSVIVNVDGLGCGAEGQVRRSCTFMSPTPTLDTHLPVLLVLVLGPDAVVLQGGQGAGKTHRRELMTCDCFPLLSTQLSGRYSTAMDRWGYHVPGCRG